MRLLWTWKDIFVDQLEDLPATDLVVHTIPTYPEARAHRARDPIYAKDEIRWQTSILPDMIGKIVERGSSLWVAKTTWVSKKETIIDENGRWPLRMVHTYCQLNDVTIKTNYPMKRMEPILDDLANPSHRYFFSADAAYGFYAVPIYPPHAYKTAFNTILGQFYYLRMPMGLTGAPATYARLKDLTFGPIPEPDPEPAVISGLSPHVSFRYFVDDDYGAAHTFDELLQFLHEVYFPRISWARLTLKPSKSRFFVPNIEPLGMMVGQHQQGEMLLYGLKANDAKRNKIERFPVPQCGEEVEKFLYFTTYLKTLIPDRVELARIMKEAVVRKKSEEKKKKGKGEVVGFQWGVPQQEAFDAIKQAIRDTVVEGGDPKRRYYLSVTSRIYGFGSVLFELAEDEEHKLEANEGDIIVRKMGRFPKGREQVIQFISQAFSDPETRYSDLERDYLAVLRSLEEVRFLILQSPYPTTVYTNATTVSLLKKAEESKGRIASWQVRIGEFSIEPRVMRGKDMSTIMAGIPREKMTQAWTREKEWEDVCLVPGLVENGIHRLFQVETPRIEYQWGKGIIIEGAAILLYVDGACRLNGTPNAKASIGIYAGPGHPMSCGRALPSYMKLTNQTAELMALIVGLEIGIKMAEKAGLSKLVLASNSAYACEGIPKWIDNWRASNFENVQNCMLFQQLDQRVEEVAKQGISIEFWKISREDNGEADRYARVVLERDEMMIADVEEEGGENLEG